MLQEVRWRWWHSLLVFVVVGGLVAIAVLPTSAARVPVWWGSSALLALLMAVSGHGISGRWLGVLIDNRSRISLSRLQMVLWTLLVLPALFSAVLGNTDAGVTKPLSIKIPTELVMVMGLGTVSLLAAPALLSRKASKTPNRSEADRQRTILQAQGVDISQVRSNVMISSNRWPSQASWSDLFRGEETGNAAQIDLARVQMLFVTLILVVGYASALGALLRGSDVISSFPPLDDGMIALLAASHAGYLTGKLIPYSREAREAK